MKQRRFDACSFYWRQVMGFPAFEDWCRVEAERLRAAGELRVKCWCCNGVGHGFTAACQKWRCYDCNGTGWKWSEER